MHFRKSNKYNKYVTSGESLGRSSWNSGKFTYVGLITLNNIFCHETSELPMSNTSLSKLSNVSKSFSGTHFSILAINPTSSIHLSVLKGRNKFTSLHAKSPSCSQMTPLCPAIRAKNPLSFHRGAGNPRADLISFRWCNSFLFVTTASLQTHSVFTHPA